LNRLRNRLTYANVMSTLAIVLVIGGGGAYAAKQALKKNSVTTPKIKNGAVTDSKLAAGAVTNSKLAPGAVTGDKLAPGALGCPVNTTSQSGFCFENSPRAADTWRVAAQTCATAGRRLATPSELWAVAQRPDVDMTNSEWTSTWFIDTNGSGGTMEATTVSEILSGVGQGVHPSAIAEDQVRAYRCVVNAGSP
jgi:hypothetical protein